MTRLTTSVPFDAELERTALAELFDPLHPGELLDGIAPEMFYDWRHRRIVAHLRYGYGGRLPTPTTPPTLPASPGRSPRSPSIASLISPGADNVSPRSNANAGTLRSRPPVGVANRPAATDPASTPRKPYVLPPGTYVRRAAIDPQQRGPF